MPPPRPKAVIPIPAARNGGAKGPATKPSAASPARASGFGLTPEQPHHKHEDEKDVCPLCVEDLDETDMSFKPCPCGYRVCLFCFEKLKLHCNSACPNCRRGYGSDEAMEYAKQLEEERAQEALRPRSAVGGAGQPPLGAAAGGDRGGPKTAPASSAARRDAGPVPAAKRGAGAMDEGGSGQGAGTGLPSGVTWANQSPSTLSRNQSVEIERPALSMDESSWPSLGTTATAPQHHPPQPAHGRSGGHARAHHQAVHASGSSSHLGNQQRHQHSPSATSDGLNCDMSGGDTRRSSSVASSMDRVASSSSLELMSQDPPVTPEQLLQLQHQHLQYQQQVPAPPALATTAAFPPAPPGFELSTPYFGAQVSTTVNGLRRAVNVPLSLGSSNVEPYPEASGMLASMQQGVAQGTVSSKEAAAQLYALLQKKDQEGQAARTRSVLAASKPPPGFGPPAGLPAAPAGGAAHAAAGNGPSAASSSVAPAAGVAVPANRPPPPPGFSALQGTVVAAPAAVRAPIQPPVQQNSDRGWNAGAGQIGLNANGTPRTYSMWSGLPGMDLGASTGLSLWGGSPTLSGLPMGSQQQPAQSYNPLGLGGMDGLAYGARPAVGAAPAGAKPPPPGFGPAAYQPPMGGAQQQQQALSTGDTVLGSAFRPQPYQPVGNSARYNPLAVQPNQQPYRPLGAGL